MAVPSPSSQDPSVGDRPVTVGFAGLTHLGIVSSMAAAAKGARAIAFDPDITLVARLKRGDLPVAETGLTELAAGQGRPEYTATVADMSQCDVIYLCRDVPTDDKGRSDVAALQPLLDDTAAAARPDAVLVIFGRVPPGFTRGHAPKDRVTYYQVPTLDIGDAVNRAINPERLIVGCADPAAPLPAAFKQFLEMFGCPIVAMRYESAELAQISASLFLVAAACTTNTLAELCEKAGADWSEIIAALKLDRRIGPHAHLTPGLGLADGVERDLAAIGRLAEAQEADTRLIEVWLANSRRRRDWVLQRLEDHVLAKTPDARLALLGLADEASTKFTENSPAWILLAALPKLKVRAYDPAVSPDPALHAELEAAKDALDACSQADAVVIMTPCREFASLNPLAMAERMRGTVVIDPLRVLDTDAVTRAGLAHHVLGRSP